MNLSEVLNVALPELQARRSKGYPRIHHKLISREQIEDGKPVVIVMVSGGPYVIRFSPEQWGLAQLFDGERSYKQIAELYQQQTGFEYSEEQIREFADGLEEAGFWYRTPLEQNITASQKLAEQRQRRTKKKNIDL